MEDTIKQQNHASAYIMCSKKENKHMNIHTKYLKPSTNSNLLVEKQQNNSSIINVKTSKPRTLYWVPEGGKMPYQTHRTT